MLVVLSPAKRLDWSEVAGPGKTEPEFRAEAASLASTARRLSKPKLQALMGLSDTLAALNKKRFAEFEDTPAPDRCRPAIRAFAGDTYAGLEANSLDPEELAYAQDHLRILSGLYGVLRPLDAIQPYRLEMGSRLKTRRGATLYDFWGDLPARSLKRAADAAGTDLLVNCASQEYFGAVRVETLGLRVIAPVFLEDKPGGPKIVSFFAKKARGAMARFVLQRRLRDPDGLRDFDAGGYSFQPDLSEPDRPVFLRAEQSAVAA
ncbi:peroxide stress protein YaaA [Tropicimonas sp. IMCC6043]|uniref:peroxide stress protein YaaA n=1 Tax=Tropicimonas sp. IMCC6043 TaxID=2510645 RepID=UPI00101C5C6E|nr:peroxide stress protein YaaA [Tropicimonas sp. IMCC6043]RYH10941.1 peroxide stress protein YaaA [Tropicimonas sp. IMCC6043]